MTDKLSLLYELRLRAEPTRREALKSRIRSRAAEIIDGDGRPSPISSAQARRSYRKSRRQWRGLVMRVAAVLVMMILWRPMVEKLERSKVDEYVTIVGERIELTLNDGTIVTLGQNSLLRVASSRGGLTREMYLEGSAVLDVAHDPTRPFIVRTAETTTRVLGTRFVIRAYSDEEATSVAVVEGKVAVVPDDADGVTGVLLTRGQVGRIGLDGMVEVEQDALEVDRLVRLANGPLQFTNIVLSAALNEMEDVYPVQFAIQDSALARQPITLRLPGGRMLDVVEAIALAVDARYEQVGDTVTFYPQ